MWLELPGSEFVNADSITQISRDGRRLMLGLVNADPLWLTYANEDDAKTALHDIAVTKLAAETAGGAKGMTIDRSKVPNGTATEVVLAAYGFAFEDGGTISFDGEDATGYTVESGGSTARVVTPNDKSNLTGDVVYTKSALTVTLVGGITFGPPHIDSVVADTDPVIGANGVALHINGWNFVQGDGSPSTASTVSIGGVPLVSLIVHAMGDIIDATLEPGALGPGTYDVVVENPDGSSDTLAAAFTVT